jgi:uncharacterized protein (TIGR01777 family)
MKKNILITGASGFLGSALKRKLNSEKYQIIELTRKASQPEKFKFNWSPMDGTWELPPQLHIHGVVHLAGESVAGWFWNSKQMAKIRDSRIKGTNLLVKRILNWPDKPEFFISSSATGFYGSRGETLISEATGTGTGFLAEICSQWEKQSMQVSTECGVRTVLLRTGLVLGSEGGIFKKIKWPFLYWLGGNLGKGEQNVSWIHINDWVKAAVLCIEDQSIKGPVNMVSPHSVTNAEFTKTLARLMHRPAFMHVPTFVLKKLPGNMGNELFLASQKILPNVLLKNDFKFQFITIESAFKEILDNEFNKSILTVCRNYIKSLFFKTKVKIKSKINN